MSIEYLRCRVKPGMRERGKRGMTGEVKPGLDCRENRDQR